MATKSKHNATNNTVQLYQFKHFDMDEFVRKYLQRVDTDKEIDRESISVYPTKPITYHTIPKRIGVRSQQAIKNKCIYMQDALIRRAYSKKELSSFSLSSNLMKNVIGNEYYDILMVLREMNYITKGDTENTDEAFVNYKKDKYSTIYKLKKTHISTIKLDPIQHKQILKYIEKTHKKLEEYREEKINKLIINKHGFDFFDRYMVSLRKIQIEDTEGLNQYIKDNITDNNKLYYQDYVLKVLNNKDKYINKIDASGRIYTCLTNLEREIKKYLNIDFILDCKNSHPLLFNHFIFNAHNINKKTAYKICNFLREIDASSVDVHYVDKYICNKLIESNIKKHSVAKLSTNEIMYIYLTSKGLLWDEIVARHPELDRNEVKVEMFRAVFYANSPVPHIWNEYAEEFKKQFPNVYWLISDWKVSETEKKTETEAEKERRREKVKRRKTYMQANHLPTDKGTKSLSIAMMALEAEIFTTILKRLYAKRWNAVHIHDCIVIPKDGNKNHPNKEQVQQIMMDVYRDFGLSPTFGD